MTYSNEELIRKFFDGELNEKEEKETLQKAARDPELRSLLRFERFLHESLSTDATSNHSIPEGFSDKVMSRIHEKEAVTEKPSIYNRAQDFLSVVFEPQTVSLRPAWGFAVAALLLVVSLWMYSPQTSIDQTDTNMTLIAEQQGDEVWMRFVYVDRGAKTIEIAGDFTNWEPMELSREEVNGEIVWTGMVPLTRGEHRYMFIRDNAEWVTDPLAGNYRDDGFGNKNAIISL